MWNREVRLVNIILKTRLLMKQVGAGAGSYVDPGGPGQNQIRSESPL